MLNSLNNVTFTTNLLGKNELQQICTDWLPHTHPQSLLSKVFLSQFSHKLLGRIPLLSSYFSCSWRKAKLECLGGKTRRGIKNKESAPFLELKSLIV